MRETSLQGDVSPRATDGVAKQQHTYEPLRSKLASILLLAEFSLKNRQTVLRHVSPFCLHLFPHEIT